MKKLIKRIGVMCLIFTVLIQSAGTFVYAAEIEGDKETDITEDPAESETDIDLNDTISILHWIEENIPEDLNELTGMSQQWWESLLPNQRRVAENLAMPAFAGSEYAASQLSYTPNSGDQVAYMSLSNTGITDGYGKTLWKITNGGGNAYCLNHGASCKSSYAYGNFRQTGGEVAYLIQNYGQSGTVSGYISIQMAVWALQTASTEAEAYSYAYTWYLKSYDASNADAWAKTTVQFYKLAKGKSGSIWQAEGPAGSQNIGKYDQFVTSSYTGGAGGGEGEGQEPVLVEPEFAMIEDSVQVSYEVKVDKTDWQTNVGLSGCKVDIFENGAKVDTLTTDSVGKASYKTTKSETFSAQYCSNYDLLTAEQQAEIDCFSSLSEARDHLESQKNEFAGKKYTYSCREITAPVGYVWQKNEKSADISGNGSATLHLTNERTLGAVELIKYDTESESGISQADALLDGAVYGIYAAENIVHQDKKTGVVFQKDELVKTAVVGKSPKRNPDGYLLNEDGSRHMENPAGKIAYTDTPGKTLFGDLELGKYYIREITPAEGYMLDETVYHATFTYKDQMIKIETRNETAAEADNTLHADDESDSKTVYSGDYVIKQGISFVKTSDNSYQTELRPIKGAGFSIYLISELSAVKSGELRPLGDSWGADDIMTFYDYDFTGESRAVLYKRADETWTKGDEKWLSGLGKDQYEVGEMFTDAEGRIETPELPYGTYVVVETTTPENHVCAKPFIVYITKDGGVLYQDETRQTVEKEYTKEEAIRYGDRKGTKNREGRVLQKQRIINNTITKTFIRVTKADEEFLVQTGTYIKPEEVVRGTVLKEGAGYRLRCLTMEMSEESFKALNWKYDGEGYLSYYDPNAKKLTGTAQNPYKTTFLRAEGKIKDCYITLPQELPVGTYELLETAAPQGYVVNGSEQSIRDTGTGRENGYEILNSPAEKTVFTIGNGAVYPDGQMGTNKYALSDSYGNLTVTVLQKNQEQKGIVEIYKHGEQLAKVSSEKHFIYEDAPIEGAQFQIIAGEDIYTQELQQELLDEYMVNKEDYLLHKKGDVVATITTDRNGWGYAAGLYIGKYKIVETVAGEGFVLNQTEELFEITPQDQTVSFDFVFSDYKNERQKLEAGVTKKDIETGEHLAGALYGLYAAEDIFSYIEYVIEDDQWIISDVPKLLAAKDTLISIAVTDEKGAAKFEEDLPLAKYYVRELKAPAGYLLSTEDVKIDGSYGSDKGGQYSKKQIHQAEFQNKSSEVSISKKDLTKGDELAGASLEVYEVVEKEDGTKSEILRESWISKDTEAHLIKGLSLDCVHILRETKPSPGYVTAEEIYFQLKQETDEEGNLSRLTAVYSKDGENWSKMQKNEILMMDDVTKFNISKKDITDGKELPGAVLEIYDESGKLVESWVSRDTPHYMEKLPIGTYTLVEKKAPAGYGYAEDLVFKVMDTGGIQKVEMFDDKGKVDVEKSTVAKVKPGESFEYTIDEVKNCTDETIEEFTLTDLLPAQVRLLEIRTGTFNQKLKYSIQYCTNKNTDWSVWKSDLDSEVNTLLPIPFNLQEGEYITAFRFCFGTVEGRFQTVTAPSYRVFATKDASGILCNEIRLTGKLDGTPVQDKDETETVVERPNIIWNPGNELKQPERIAEQVIRSKSAVNSGDEANVALWAGMLFATVLIAIVIREHKRK